MDDKEVGELWERYRKYPSLRGAEGLQLIRKLVEERAKCDAEHCSCTGLALRDFGIDPATW